jgi:hypothetical protein
MSSAIIARNLTSDITFMLHNRDIFGDYSMSYWYDETDFDINEVAKNVAKQFPNSKVIEVYKNGFKINWNGTIMNISNSDEYN